MIKFTSHTNKFPNDHGWIQLEVMSAAQHASYLNWMAVHVGAWKQGVGWALRVGCPVMDLRGCEEVAAVIGESSSVSFESLVILASN